MADIFDFNTWKELLEAFGNFFYSSVSGIGELLNIVSWWSILLLGSIPLVLIFIECIIMSLSIIFGRNHSSGILGMFIELNSGLVSFIYRLIFGFFELLIRIAHVIAEAIPL